MDSNQNLKTDSGCPQYPTCVYRIELLEKWKEAVEQKFDRLTNLLLANLSGVILTLVAIIGGLIIYFIDVQK